MKAVELFVCIETFLTVLVCSSGLAQVGYFVVGDHLGHVVEWFVVLSRHFESNR